jgi:hypothetical protein
MAKNYKATDLMESELVGWDELADGWVAKVDTDNGWVEVGCFATAREAIAFIVKNR